jgi:hypothetical protein
MEAEKKFKIWFDGETGILRSEIYKPFNPERATAVFEEIFNNHSEEQQRYILVFLGPDAQAIIDKETRRLAREKTKDNKWEKIAIYGAKSGVRMLAKVVLTAIGKGKDTKFFPTEKECVEWLVASQQER